MKVGFYSPYRRCDASYAVLPVAMQAVAMGCSVEVLATGTPQPLKTYLDPFVLKPDKVAYRDWVVGCDVVVHASPATAEQLRTARAASTETILLCLWDEIEEDTAHLLRLYDRVVCPSRCVTQLLRDEFHLGNLTSIAWDVDVPHTSSGQGVDPERIAVLWPVEGSQALRQDHAFVDVIDSVLAAAPNVWLTVLFSSSLPPATIRAARRLADKFNYRLEMVLNPGWDRNQLHYGRHDLTVWPSLIESVGLVGLCSLSMGTPCLAFDHPVIGEVIRNGKSGILVPCELDYNWCGVPYVAADHGPFLSQFLELVKQPALIDVLRHGTHRGLAERRQAFVTAWTAIFGG